MGKIITKLYLYDSSQEANGYKGTDYSKYILQGDSDIDNLDDTLDTAEITLAGLNFREEFAPSTKFIIQKYQQQLDQNNQIIENLWKEFHWEVSSDTVEQPILSDNNYFNHSISFVEPSVEAQQRLVDNIAVTYRLKDVTLDSAPTYDTNALAIQEKINADVETKENFGYYNHNTWFKYIIGHQFKWVMPDWYQVSLNGVTKTPSWDDWNDFKLYQEIPSGESSKTIQLPIPMLECLCGVKNTKTYRHNGYCSIDVIVQRQLINSDETEIINTIRVNPALNVPEEQWTSDDIRDETSWIQGYGRIISSIKGQTAVWFPASGTQNPFETYVSQVAEPDNLLDINNRVLTLTIEAGYKYKIILKKHIFNLDYEETIQGLYKPETYPYTYCVGKTNFHTALIVNWYTTDNSGIQTNDNYPLLTMSFNSVLAGTNYSIYFKSATIENALNLFNKAQLTTQNIKKIQGIVVDETPKTFYLIDADRETLQNTTIVENFYNQKNLWEIFMDIGKYIHARPKVKFGSDNRYVMEWKKYGRTDQFEDYGNTVSIYNSRFIEEYVSACSSYVANMVQLGGIITEIVAPKSSSEDYLVYNDVAEIITEKNIIEIVDMEVIRKSDGEIRNLAGKGIVGESPNGYVFEENVYNLLSINQNDNVNKGLAIYYKLGTNKIIGLNYRLPTINTGDGANDYAIKRIIGTVFGIIDKQNWANIKVNDYLFKITYRTKDTLRSNQTRPDLRKYLRASKYDRVPQHNQFNNQQDVVVDSVKFGNNIYGKLIRTGNRVYTKLEWLNGLSEIKQSGDLYNIDGELYYVSKVKNTYFTDHIISEVEFSKDFNRLSEIIGIPSEPRFFEISEQSLIKREISLDDYVILSSTHPPFVSSEHILPTYINYMGLGTIAELLFNSKNYPTYAITVFKNDIDKETVAGNETFKVETCTPVCTYSIENTLTIEWDMKDNFSAGDQVISTNLSIDSNKPFDTAYNTLIPYRYADAYGRCDMIDFAIIDNTELTNQAVMNLPQNPFDLTSSDTIIAFGNHEYREDYGKNDNGIIVLKDNREALSFNYNLQMLTDSDRFVLSAYLWQENKENLKIGLLKEEVNKISNSTIPNSSFLIENIPYETSDYGITIGGMNYVPHCSLYISNILDRYATSINKTTDELLEGVKAIVLYSTNEVNDYVNSGAKYFVMARNITGLSTISAKSDWYVSCLTKNKFNIQ